jgi:hypothetical protein
MPPTIAVMSPADGGNPDAIEIPKHNGIAMRNTKKPDNRSARQFSFKPANPVLGKPGEIILDINISIIDQMSKP